MKLFEFDEPLGRYDASADVINTATITDTRKDKLTLRDLNKLKKLRAIRRLESLKQQDIVAVIYGAPNEVDDAGGGGDFL